MTDPKSESIVLRLLTWVVTSWKAVVAVAGGFTVILTLLFMLLPDSPEPCGGRRATLSMITVDERVRYGAYLELESASAGSASRRELDTFGRVVHFRIETEGFKGERLPIYWWMLSAGGEAVDEGGLRKQLAYEISPEECFDGGKRKIWVKLPSTPGTYKVEVRLFDPAGREQDSIQTSPFVVSRTARQRS